MAFCNACGATLEANAKFCPGCGKPTPVASSAQPAAQTSTPQGSGSGLKVVLIVVVAIVALGIVGSVVATLIGLNVARRTRVTEKNGQVKVETPFGTVASSENPEDAAKNLGIDLYPGAQALKGESAAVKVGGISTVSAQFETSDSADKVSDFYRSKFPNANVAATNQGQTTIVSTDNKGMVTITIEPRDGKTYIQIARVSGKAAGGDSTN